MIRLIALTILFPLLLSGCSRKYSWERELYFQRDKETSPFSVWMASTRYGEGLLSSKGPYRPVLNFSTECDQLDVKLGSIVLLWGEGKVALPIERFKRSFSERPSGDCVVNFASDIWLTIDFTTIHQFRVRVRYFTEENQQNAEEYTAILEASFSSGTTRHGWISA